MLSSIRALLRSPMASVNALEALVQGSANQQRVINEALAAFVQASTSQQLLLTEKLSALLAGSLNEQRLLAEIAERLRASPPEEGTIYSDRLSTNGFAVVRDFLDKDDADDLRAAVQSVYSVLEDSTAGAMGAVDPGFEKNFRQWRGVWLKPLPEFLAGAHADLAERFTRLTSQVERCTKRIFGQEWRLYTERSYFRRHIGMTRRVPWHVDADAAALNRAQSFNVWMPLDAVGRELPSLDVVPRSHITMQALPLITDEHRSRDDAFVASVGHAHTPMLDLGDAMALDQFTLHRTQQIGSAKMVRTACEFRFEHT